MYDPGEAQAEAKRAAIRAAAPLAQRCQHWDHGCLWDYETTCDTAPCCLACRDRCPYPCTALATDDR